MDDWSVRIPPSTCEGGWHISRWGRRRCDCGERRSPSYRNLFQRIKDRREFRRQSKRAKRWAGRNKYYNP